VKTLQKYRFKLSTIIIIFVCTVVIMSLLITDLLVTNTTSETIENQLEDKAITVSRTIAESKIVKDGLTDIPDEEISIQEYTTNIQQASDVLFVVVMDMEGIRKSHPDVQKIGKHFVGGDEQRALNGDEYISRSTGTLGKSLRAFTPIYDNNQNQIGAVAVGISLDAVTASIQQSHRKILIGSTVGVLIGIIGAFLLARYIKNSLFGLEPYAIARIHEERNTMLHSVHEGIIAIDRTGTILLVNKSARRIFKQASLKASDPLGMKISDFLPGTRLEDILMSREAELDQEQLINGVSIITNRVPLIVNGHVVGAIATFRDKTEVNQLAEQLTGVQMYADTLRAQSHEFRNQLQVLLGLIKMEDYEEVTYFISKLVDHQADEIGSVTKYIKDPIFAGFIIGKMSYARESHVAITIDFETEIPQAGRPEITHELITILGNIIDNAIDSVSTSEKQEIRMTFSYIDNLLSMTIADTGEGIPEDKLEDIFLQGHTSKDGKHRGFGLFLTRQSIDKLEGSIDVDSVLGKGTTFTIIVPFDQGEDL
jgi:two-component system, CitB family, sensor histidine kinase MalK